MREIKKFVTNVFIGGLVVVLPISILINVFQWLYNWTTDVIAPVTGVIIATTATNLVVADLIAFFGILACCFFIGLLVRTRIGKWVYEWTENNFLSFIPGYKTLRDVISHLNPDQQRAFSKPVLYSWDKGDNYLLAYVTDEYPDDRYAIFIPTSPSPMNGYVIQTTKEHIKFLDISSETMMEAVIGCGLGSRKIMSKVVVD